jgi:hypothetical protein
MGRLKLALNVDSKSHCPKIKLLPHKAGSAMQLRNGIKDLQVDGAEPNKKDAEIVLSTEGFVVVRFGSIKRSHATSSGQIS